MSTGSAHIVILMLLYVQCKFISQLLSDIGTISCWNHHIHVNDKKFTCSFCGPCGAVGTIFVALSLASNVITHAATIRKPENVNIYTYI